MAKPRVPLDRNLSSELRTFLEDLGAWRSFTPTVTAGSGALTTASATGRYTQISTTIIFQTEITITTNGSGATDVRSTLPVECAANAIGTGLETVSAGVLVVSIDTATPLVAVTTFTDGTYPGADGNILIINGVYESV